MNDINVIIGARLREARVRMGLTQRQAASLVNITREELSYYETGRRDISLGKLARLAALYGYSMDHFLKGDAHNESEVAVAFRASDLCDDDMEIVAWARRLISDIAALDAVLEKRGR